MSEITEKNHKATALGLNNTFIFLLNVTTPICISHAIVMLQSMSTTISTHNVYSLSLLIIPLLFILSILFAMMLKKSDMPS